MNVIFINADNTAWPQKGFGPLKKTRKRSQILIRRKFNSLIDPNNTPEEPEAEII